MNSSYQIVDRKDSQGFARYLAKNGQLLLPLVELLETSRMAVDERIDVLGRSLAVHQRRPVRCGQWARG